MKLVTFIASDGTPHVGALMDDLQTVSDLTASGALCFRDMLALMDGGEEALAQARQLLASPAATVPLNDVHLLAPVPVPRQMYDCITFEQHVLNAGNHTPKIPGVERAIKVNNGVPPIFFERPVYYKPNRFSVVGPDADIVRPNYSRHLDYELEFGVFLGKSGKNWTVEEAADAIFGYCIFNDVSARDQQMREMRGMLGPSKGKDFDTGNVMGPWLVTKDEIPDPPVLRMRAWINGELVTDGSSAKMMHSFAEIISYSSQDETRHPGEFFASGTVGGGCSLEHGRWLKHGDILELEAEGLGRLRNRIIFPEVRPAIVASLEALTEV